MKTNIEFIIEMLRKTIDYKTNQIEIVKMDNRIEIYSLDKNGSRYQGAFYNTGLTSLIEKVGANCFYALNDNYIYLHIY